MATTIICSGVLFCFAMFWHVSTSQKENYKLVEALSDASISNVVADKGCHAIKKDSPVVSNNKMMSLMWCTKQCWRLQKKYALVSDGTKCHCDDELLDPPSRPRCIIPCPNLKAEWCGGKNQASVRYTGYVPIKWKQLKKLYYSTRMYKEQRATQRTPAMAKHDGSCSKFKLQKYVFFVRTNIMTKELCVVHCFHYKYVYALATIGDTCYCTSTSPTRDLKGQCNRKCDGDANETCGGGVGVYTAWLTGHYKTKDYMSRNAFKPTHGIQQNWNLYLSRRHRLFRGMMKMKTFPVQKPPIIGNENAVAVKKVSDTLKSGNKVVVIGGVLGVLALLVLMRVGYALCSKGSDKDIDDDSEKATMLEEEKPKSSSHGKKKKKSDRGENEETHEKRKRKKKKKKKSDNV